MYPSFHLQVWNITLLALKASMMSLTTQNCSPFACLQALTSMYPQAIISLSRPTLMVCRIQTISTCRIIIIMQLIFDASIVINCLCFLSKVRKLSVAILQWVPWRLPLCSAKASQYSLSRRMERLLSSWSNSTKTGRCLVSCLTSKKVHRNIEV